MIQVGVGKDFLAISRIAEEPKEYIILKGKKEILELFKGLGKLCYYYSEDIEKEDKK